LWFLTPELGWQIFQNETFPTFSRKFSRARYTIFGSGYGFYKPLELLVQYRENRFQLRVAADGAVRGIFYYFEHERTSTPW